MSSIHICLPYVYIMHHPRSEQVAKKLLQFPKTFKIIFDTNSDKYKINQLNVFFFLIISEHLDTFLLYFCYSFRKVYEILSNIISNLEIVYTIFFGLLLWILICFFLSCSHDTHTKCTREIMISYHTPIAKHYSVSDSWTLFAIIISGCFGCFKSKFGVCNLINSSRPKIQCRKKMKLTNWNSFISRLKNGDLLTFPRVKILFKPVKMLWNAEINKLIGAQNFFK